MSLGTWISAARPRTLLAGVAPVAVGTVLASELVKLDWLAAGGCLAGALLIQVGTNFANDAFDGLKGADGANRLGPQRAVASGLIGARAMLAAAATVLLVAYAIGLYLTMLGGWPIQVLGIVGILCAFAYTGGPYALAYHGLGDLFVLLFFGLFAVIGSAWVQIAREHAQIPTWWWLIAVAVGLQATAIIIVNNLRDRAGDAEVGKRTICVRLGDRASRHYYALVQLFAAAAWWGASLAHRSTALIAAAVVATLFAVGLSLKVKGAIGAGLNRYLGLSALAEFATALAFCVTGIAIDALPH